MNSNENYAMEWNDVLSEMNILICYMHELELRMQSYNAINMSTWIWDSWDLVKIIPSEKVKPGRRRAGRADPGQARARLDEGTGGSRPDPPDLAGDDGDGRRVAGDGARSPGYGAGRRRRARR